MKEKHKLFCDHYLIHLNGKQAAIEAGYKESRAEITAIDILKRPDVQEYIQARQTERSEKLQLSQDWVLERLKCISDRCMQAEPVLIKDDEGNWVESGEFKFDSAGANKSTELIGKHLGMFVQKVDVTSKGESMVPKVPMVKLPDGTMLEI